MKYWFNGVYLTVLNISVLFVGIPVCILLDWFIVVPMNIGGANKTWFRDRLCHKMESFNKLNNERKTK